MARKKQVKDFRDSQAYSIPEVSHYLNMPASTIRYWVSGQGGAHEPVIVPASAGTPTLLSFFNLIEVHILGTITKEYSVKLQKVRSALEYLYRNFETPHPLVKHSFETDGSNLFIEHLGQLINISEDGQQAMRELLDAALKRIEWDNEGLPTRLFPFTHSDIKKSPSIVVIQPGIAFGRPVIVGSGIPTEIIAERYKAGDSVQDLASDYERKTEEIEEAIRCELKAA